MLDKHEIRSWLRYLDEATERELDTKEAELKTVLVNYPREADNWLDARFMLKLLCEERQARACLRDLEARRAVRRDA